jgi:hypothetical protein
MLLGVTVIVAVGAGEVAAGGGGGGAGTAFLWQPAVKARVTKAVSKAVLCCGVLKVFLLCFSFISLFPTPIGHRTSAALDEPMLLRPIGKHGPQLRPAAIFALEYDVSSIRRP